MKIRMVFLLVVISLLFCGCTIHHQARLYDMETGNVILVNARIRGNRALNDAVLPSGEHCNGESITGGEGSVTIGSSYSSGNLFSSWGSIYTYGSTTNYSSATIPASQRGVCILICENNVTFDCEYRVSSFSVQGYGICRDNRGRYYRLVF